jgi:hypothetical protein
VAGANSLALGGVPPVAAPGAGGAAPGRPRDGANGTGPGRGTGGWPDPAAGADRR